MVSDVSKKKYGHSKRRKKIISDTNTRKNINPPFICRLFNDVVNNSEHTAVKSKLERMQKEAVRTYFKARSLNLPGD